MAHIFTLPTIEFIPYTLSFTLKKDFHSPNIYCTKNKILLHCVASYILLPLSLGNPVSPFPLHFTLYSPSAISLSCSPHLEVRSFILSCVFLSNTHPGVQSLLIRYLLNGHLMHSILDKGIIADTSEPFTS